MTFSMFLSHTSSGPHLVVIILPIIALFVLGFATRRLTRDPATLVKWLNNFIIYLSLPSLILLQVPTLAFSAAVFIPAGIAWAWLLAGSLLVLVFSRRLDWPRQTEGAMLLLVTMGNTSFLGYPMVLAFFNDAVLAYAIFFDQLGGFLILSTFGFVIVALYTPASHGDVRSVRVVEITRKIFSFPPFIALLVALFIPLGNVMNIAQSGLELIAQLLMPAALFVLGVQFQPRLLAEHRAPLASAIVLKLIVAPVLASLMLFGLGADDDVRIATVFEAAMPCMITPGLMAINAGIAPRFVATLLGYSTVCAFITLPLVAWMIT